MIKNIKFVYKYFWQHKQCNKKSVIFSLILGFVVIVSNIATPLYFQHIIDSLIKNGQDHFSLISIATFALTYGTLWIINNAAGRIRIIHTCNASYRSVSIITNEIIEATFCRSSKLNYSNRLALIERIRHSFPEYIESLIWQIVPTFIQTLIAFVIVCNITDIYIALLLLFTILIYLFSVTYNLHKIQFLQNKLSRADNNFVEKLLDIISNIEIIKLFKKSRFEINNLRSITDSKENFSTIINAQIEKIGSVQVFIVGISLTISTFLLISANTRIEINASHLILVHSYLIQFTLPLSYFGFVILSLQRGNTIFEELAFLGKNDYTAKKEQDNYLEDSSSMLLKFEDVSLQKNNKLILKTFNFELYQGLVVGIYGSSGSGKSSFLSIITGLNKISDGKIYTKNRISFSAAPQESTIFNNTILYNITYGTPDPSNEKIQEVLKICNLLPLIKKFPEGLNTYISKDSNKLSKGEIQRLNIARCILKDADIYIFDEPTSSLDEQNANEIFDALIDYLKDKTIIIVSHMQQIIKKTNLRIRIEQGLFELQSRKSNKNSKINY